MVVLGTTIYELPATIRCCGKKFVDGRTKSTAVRLGEARFIYFESGHDLILSVIAGQPRSGVTR